MSSQIDKLFNKKLKEHTVVPSDEAWMRLSLHLDSRSRGFPWLKVAAVLLPAVLLLTGIPSRVDLPVPLPGKVAVQDRSVVVPATEKIQQERVAGKAAARRQAARLPHALRQAAAPEAHTNGVEEAVTGEDALHEEHVTAAVPGEQRRADVTIHYSVEDASRFFDKNNLAGATPDGKKPSKLQKLKDLAEDLHPVDELRQFKQDILAFSFKNEKNENR